MDLVRMEWHSVWEALPPTPVQPWSTHLGEINLETTPVQLLVNSTSSFITNSTGSSSTIVTVGKAIVHLISSLSCVTGSLHKTQVSTSH